MRFSILPIAAGMILWCGSPSAVSADDMQYPQWIAERYCGATDDPAKCRASLDLPGLIGQTHASDGAMDENADGEVDQWAQTAAGPRLAMCTYRHPDHPGWNFEDDCFYTIHSSMSVFTYEWMRVGVKNGSGFVLQSKDEHGKPTEYTANEEPARLRTVDGYECYEVLATRELFCVRPIVTIAPGGPPQ